MNGVNCLGRTYMTYEWCELSGKDIYDIRMVWTVWEGHMTYEWCELSGRDI